MNNNISLLLNKELHKKNDSNSLFIDENVFSKNYFPQNVLFREKQFKELIIKFKGIFNIDESRIDFFQSITLLGPVGCGKSLVAKKFCIDFIEALKLKYSTVTFIYRHINCRRNKTIFVLLFDLLRSLIPHFPNRGFSTNELLNMLHILLINSNSYLFLILDEIDYLFHNNEVNLFFENLTFNETLSTKNESRRISVIYITRNKNFLLLLDSENKFGILNNLIRFENYKKDEIKEILMNRSSFGINDGIVSLTIFDYMTDLIFNKNDIRFGIELMWRTVRIAEFSKSPKIEIAHVKKAFNLMQEI